MPAAFVRDEHPDTVAAIKAAFESGQLDPHAKGVSNVQRVPWMINEFMVPVVEKLAKHVETRFKTLEFFKTALRDDIDRARKSVRHFGPRTTLISGAGSTPFRTSTSGATIAFGAFSCSGMGSQSAIARIGLRLPLPTPRARKKERGVSVTIVSDNSELIRRTANDPFETVEHWKKFSDPFQFVSACRELIAAPERSELRFCQCFSTVRRMGFSIWRA